MAQRFRARPGRLLVLALSIVAVLALGASSAYAIEEPGDALTFEQLFQKLQNTPVYEEACTETCHGNISKTKNYSSAIIFQHGYHKLVPCDSCHPKFPHRADQTIERPTMKGCFDCHGVRHGPDGIIATDKCEDCHVTPKERLRPAFHVWGWSGQPHVKPAEEAFSSRCAMCHKPDSCTECHDAEGIKWSPPNDNWAFDPGDGCYGCHGSATLLKTSSGTPKSYQVTGIDESVHREVTCQQCHQDYRYDDLPAPTPMWTVNAGMACRDCHQKSTDTTLSAPVPEYDRSVHAEKISEGNYDSATCASCHGGHFIYSLQTAVGAARMQGSAYRTCARCKQHGDEYVTYNDYYHGKAYKQGNPDAPACWDCHASHAVLPSDDASSAVSDENTGETCGQEGCHKGSTEEFGAEAGQLIHEQQVITDENPVLQFLKGLTQ